jgi:SAM-dependent methyltransferase
MTVQTLLQKYYFDDPQFEDGTAAFHKMLAAHIPQGCDILEVGAGPSNPTTHYIASLGSVVGLDIDHDVSHNTDLLDKRIYDGKLFPFPDRSFDACVSNYVLEHVESASLHWQEIKRVLRPNGVFCFRTPNRIHYVALASSLLPHSVHALLANKLRKLPADSHSPYPTYYRSNTLASIRTHARRAQLLVKEMKTIEKEPWYGRAHVALMLPMIGYERVVNLADCFQNFRANIIGCMRRPER